MTDRSVDEPPSRSDFSSDGGAVTAMVVLIDAGENAVAQADSIVAAIAIMANRGLNRMELTRGDETLDIVRRIHIFSVRCSGVAVRRTLRSSREAGRLRTARAASW